MENLENLLWPLERQARQLQDTLADAMVVWRDANARTADTRFLTPRATAEGETLTAIKAQHHELERAATEIDQALAQHRLADEESSRVRRLGEDVRHAAAATRERTASSATVTSSADHASAQARAAIDRANTAGR